MTFLKMIFCGIAILKQSVLVISYAPTLSKQTGHWQNYLNRINKTNLNSLSQIRT